VQALGLGVYLNLDGVSPPTHRVRRETNVKVSSSEPIDFPFLPPLSLPA
jgi:hypothetical protein